MMRDVRLLDGLALVIGNQGSDSVLCFAFLVALGQRMDPTDTRALSRLYDYSRGRTGSPEDIFNPNDPLPEWAYPVREALREWRTAFAAAEVRRRRGTAAGSGHSVYRAEEAATVAVLRALEKSP